MASFGVTACLLALLPTASSFHLTGVSLRQRGAGTVTRSTPLSTVSAAGRSNGQGSEDAFVTRKDALQKVATAILGAGLAVPAVVAFKPQEAQARKPGVNRPELLPKDQTNVIDLVGVLTKGQAKRINKQLEELEKATGYRLRLLCQRYPETPGLAIKDYWKVDDKTMVMVVDVGEENTKAGGVNILNFNVGDGLRLNLPPQFWQRTQNKYGNRFYVKENGADGAVISTIDSISFCLRSDSGFCVDPPDLKKVANDEAVLRSIGRAGR